MTIGLEITGSISFILLLKLRLGKVFNWLWGGTVAHTRKY